MDYSFQPKPEPFPQPEVVDGRAEAHEPPDAGGGSPDTTRPLEDSRTDTSVLVSEGLALGNVALGADEEPALPDDLTEDELREQELTIAEAHLESSVPGQPSDTPSAADGGGGDVPPASTELALTGPEPPGRSLEKVLDFVGQAPNNIHRAIAEKVESDPEFWGLDVARNLPEVGGDHDQAVAAIAMVDANEHAHSLAAAATNTELETGQSQLAGELEASGLQLTAGPNDIGVEISEPTAFAAAVTELPSPASEAAQAQRDDQLGQLVRAGVSRTTDAVIEQHAEAVYATLNPQAHHDFVTNNIPPAAGSRDHQFAAEFIGSAPQLAEALKNQGASEPVVAPARQLATAAQEGMIIPYTAGVVVGALGCSNEAPGVDRFTNDAEWGRVYDYAKVVHDNAPDAQITQEIRDTLIGDIDRALDGPHNFNDPQLPPDFLEGREAAFEEARPLLQRARARILEIIP